MKKKISREQKKVLRKAQQGEVNAVYMYERLARKVKTVEEKEAFERLAKDEARHADVFRAYTKRKLKPVPIKGIMVPLLYGLIGRKRLFPIIAKGEYDAAEKYKNIIEEFPEAEEVMNDEVHHGNAVMELLK